MRCSFCGFEFDEDSNISVCRSCASKGGCNMIKCPKCNYKMPRTGNIVKFFKKIKEKFK